MDNTENKKAKQEYWITLCEYVKKEILQYDDDMKIPKFIILRLRGLEKGQFMANKRGRRQANYDYKTILITFKLCKEMILQGFKSNQTKFVDEKHKFNYAMVIIENEINDVVLRLKRARDSENKTIKIKLNNQSNNSAKYKSMRKKKSNKELEKLW